MLIEIIYKIVCVWFFFAFAIEADILNLEYLVPAVRLTEQL